MAYLTKITIPVAFALMVIAIAILSAHVDAQMQDCTENGMTECKEFLKNSICGRLVWCYKQKKIGDLTSICSFTDVQNSDFGLQHYGPATPNNKKCKEITDKDSNCYKLCHELKNKVYPFMGFFNVCLKKQVAYHCKSTKVNKFEFCGCGQIADVDAVNGKTVSEGDYCK